MSSPRLTRRGAQQAKIQTRGQARNDKAAQGASDARNSSGGLQGAGDGASSVLGRKLSQSLIEAKRKARQLRLEQAKLNDHCGTENIHVTDTFQNAASVQNTRHMGTALIYDLKMEKYFCQWDKKHPECPERFTRILERFADLQLLDRCIKFPSRAALRSEILHLHSEDHYDKLSKTAGNVDSVELETFSSCYDSIYIHPGTFECALLSAGCAIDLIDIVGRGLAQNGMAVIRPPGHHAMATEYNGYCFFNNVALAAKHALDTLNLQKVMIIDWDVHHGQGTQRFFYEDPKVLYFSVHRFEFGKFWPHLVESNFDAIGSGAGLGYNFNVPLNKTGMGNADYLAIFQQILVPVAIEYQPELIIISAGYDAALGCPEGEMNVTPACYAHMVHSLQYLAQSRIAVVLEGGYCLDSLAESAALTLRSLLGDPCPQLSEPLAAPSQEVQDAILNCIYVHRSTWRCLQTQKTYTMEETERSVGQMPDLHVVKRTFIGGDPVPDKYPTRDTGPLQSVGKKALYDRRLFQLKKETDLLVPNERVCYAFDNVMLEHTNTFDEGHPEHPNRIKNIYKMLGEYNLLERMTPVKLRFATIYELHLAHEPDHVTRMRNLEDEGASLEHLGLKFNSVYFHKQTYKSATAAVGMVLEVVDKILFGETRSGVCIVRPPGHHAGASMPHGFCIFNNVAVAAQYAIRDFKLNRVLIVDWDVHHGNGTQHIFESNPNVLYISLHRYENGSFFPKGPLGNYDQIGLGAGKGFNVNIPWNRKGMGDLEYVLAFQKIVMPIAYEFDPELVLVSAGFDAAIGDPLGGCKVTPECFGLLTHWISALAKGRVILCLEGGYNTTSIAYSMTMCTKALLGDPIPAIVPTLNRTTTSVTTLSCIETLQNCQKVQQPYWKSLVFNKKLPQFDSQNNTEYFIVDGLSQLQIRNTDAATQNISNDHQEQACSSKSITGLETLKQCTEKNKEAILAKNVLAVCPLSSCPHLSQLPPDTMLPTINTEAPCADCSDTRENWLCLSCYKVLCSRRVHKHMFVHSQKTLHPMAFSLTDSSVWCYICVSYVDNPRLYEIKNRLHRMKFGKDMPWTYKVQRQLSTPNNNGNYNLSRNTDDFSDVPIEFTKDN